MPLPTQASTAMECRHTDSRGGLQTSEEEEWRSLQQLWVVAKDYITLQHSHVLKYSSLQQECWSAAANHHLKGLQADLMDSCTTTWTKLWVQSKSDMRIIHRQYSEELEIIFMQLHDYDTFTIDYELNTQTHDKDTSGFDNTNSDNSDNSVGSVTNETEFDEWDGKFMVELVLNTLPPYINYGYILKEVQAFTKGSKSMAFIKLWTHEGELHLYLELVHP